MLFGAYDVKLGVYKHAKNVRTNIAKIKYTKYRKKIIVEKKGRFHYVHAVIASNKEAREALHVYKRVFKDAFISKKPVILKKKVKKVKAVSNAKKVTNVKKVSPPPVKEEKEPEEIKPPCDVKELLTDKTVYVCYEKKSSDAKRRVVEMRFGRVYVEYMPIHSKDQPLKIFYSFQKDTVLLPISGLKVMHQVYQKEANFLYVKSFINGKEAHALRYYFDENAALAFVAGN